VALSSEPLNTVTVALSSDTPAEGIVTTPPSPPLPPTLTFTSLNWNAPQTVIVTGVDDFVVDGDIPYNIVLDPASEGDALYNSLPNVDVGATNYDAPTIGWVKPVVDEGIYISDGFSPIQLEVINLSNEPINRVRFYRWVDAIGYWVTIGEALTPPYKEVLLPGELESGWNQVFAFAFGPPNPVQTFSKHVRILIIMDYGDQIHLPLVYK
jgi:hypothetical protein